MMGLIGWSVAIPTLLGAACGIWLDTHYPGGRSWTLALLVAGLVIGCFNAWHWVAKEERAMREQQETMMNETVTLVSAGVAGLLLGVDFSSAACGGRCARACRQSAASAAVYAQPGVADRCHRRWLLHGR
jgi:hypothetical protein